MSKSLKRISIGLIVAAVILGTVLLLVGAGQKQGWIKDGDDWTYYGENGDKAQDAWVRDNGQWYYLAADGVMQTGWLKHLDNWYYLRQSGSMVTGWRNINSTWYYFKTNGIMQTGWLEDNGKAYYLRPGGAMATGWVKVDNDWYFMLTSGARKTGWHSSGNSWYYLAEGGKMAVGWVTVLGKNYYFHENGAMAANTEIDGRKLGPSGAEIIAGEAEEPKPNDDNETTEPDNTGTGALAGKTIGIDPGHQGKGNSAKEPQAPGSSTMKAKVTSGTRGVYTKVYEHVINLQAGLVLRDKLEAEGAKVVMSRTSADVDISNVQRAQMMNEAGCDLVIRLHADGVDSASVHGVSVLVPTGSYTKAIEAESLKAGQAVLDAYVKATGAKNRGISKRDDQTGFNWSKVPVINIEMGFMSNKAEDIKLNDASYRDKGMTGVVTGVKKYFGV